MLPLTEHLVHTFSLNITTILTRKRCYYLHGWGNSDLGAKQGLTQGHRDRDQDSKSDLIPEPPLLTALLSKTLMRMISHSRLHEPEYPEGHKRPICSLLSPTASQSLRFFQPWRISAPNVQPQCAWSEILNTARMTLRWVSDQEIADGPRGGKSGSISGSLHYTQMIWEFTAVQRQGLWSQLCHCLTLSPR